MKKIKINVLSSADKVDGQGVGSAYLEQVDLIKNAKELDVKINRKDKADINHFHTIDLKNYYKMKKKGAVNVAYVHFLPETLDGSIKLPKLLFQVFKKYVIDFYKAADYLVVVNPIFKKDLLKYGLKEKRIYYIPNYVSKDKFYKLNKDDKEKIRKQYHLKKEDFVVLGVGQVQTRKGILDFIETAKKMPDTKFIWCGGFSFGHITDGYEQLKKIYENPPKNVKFLGIIDRNDMNDIYNMVDVLFMPSYNELFPMSILEAVNSNTPLLLRDLDLYEDILFKKYLKANSVDGFVEELNKLKNDSVFYKKNEINSKEISEYYSKEHVLKMWIEFYQKIIKK